ncbi:MAG: transcriptional regulator, TetR family [Thermoleophilia bacterium]|nr:transcriptional regulator, TetR family [Thermoleophilia bacterium]MCZ4496217.1 transcriptional regulator, TetR family [Thermoleophilia bacterium]
MYFEYTGGMDATIGLRERKKLQTRHAIEAAALRLFAERGFANVTMSEIAQAADVSLRTVAVHYPTKQDLVLAHHERNFAQLMDGVEQRAEGVSALDAMQAWVEGLIATEPCGREDHEELQLQRLCGQVIQADPELLARSRGVAARVQPMLVRGIARDLGVDEHHLTPLIAAAAATGIFTMLAELGTEADTSHDAAAAMVVIDQVFTYLRAGLATLPTD